MKTSEFKSKLMEMRYWVYETGTALNIRSSFGKLCAVVSTVSGEFELNTVDLGLIKTCIEYVETPIQEREDIKKYVVVIPDKENESKERVYALSRVGDGRIMINRPKIENLSQNERYHLTEEEIKRNHSYLWQFAEEVK